MRSWCLFSLPRDEAQTCQNHWVVPDIIWFASVTVCVSADVCAHLFPGYFSRDTSRLEQLPQPPPPCPVLPTPPSPSPHVNILYIYVHLRTGVHPRRCVHTSQTHRHHSVCVCMVAALRPVDLTGSVRIPDGAVGSKPTQLFNSPLWDWSPNEHVA